MNEQIRISPIRVIGAANEQIGVIPTYEALRMAQEAGFVPPFRLRPELHPAAHFCQFLRRQIGAHDRILNGDAIAHALR